MRAIDIFHRGEKRIKLEFPYNSIDISKIKEIEEAE